jgi:hypothetical protein
VKRVAPRLKRTAISLTRRFAARRHEPGEVRSDQQEEHAYCARQNLNGDRELFTQRRDSARDGLKIEPVHVSTGEIVVPSSAGWIVHFCFQQTWMERFELGDRLRDPGRIIDRAATLTGPRELP